MRRLAAAFLLIQAWISAPATAQTLGGKLAALTKDHAIVAIGESHRSRASHGFLQALLRDPAFICGFDDVILEYGNRAFQETADRFVVGADIPMPEKRRMWSNTTQFLVWDSPLYEQVYDTVRALNVEKRCPKPIRLLLGDPGIRWEAVKTKEDYGRFAERDQSYADVIETEVLAKKRRGLFLAGGGHIGKGRPAEFKGRATAAELIEQRHPGIVYSIDSVGDATRAAKLGLTTPLDFIGFAGTAKAEMSFGNFVTGGASMRVMVNGVPTWVPTDKLTWPKVTDIVDAFVYLPVGDDDKVPAAPSYYSDPAYRAELRRRAAILSAFWGMDFAADLDAAFAGKS